MKKTIAKLDAQIDSLESEFKANDSSMQRLKSKHYEITTQEVGREKPIMTSFIGDRDRKYIIDFFGLEQPDVEWYKIELKEDKE